MVVAQNASFDLERSAVQRLGLLVAALGVVQHGQGAHRVERQGVFVAADALNYLGALDACFAAVARAAAPEALLVFSLEHLDGEGYRLLESGRFAHDPASVTSALERHGLVPLEVRPIELRCEGGAPTRGDLYVARAG